MPQAPRQLTPDGLLKCSGPCQTAKPLKMFYVDKSASYGRKHRCKVCEKEAGRKTHLVTPEIALVTLHDLRGMVFYPEDRVAPGSWRKVVETLQAAPPRMAVRVRIEENYHAHNGAQAMMKKWGRWLGVKLMVLHGEACVVVKRRHGSNGKNTSLHNSNVE